MSRRKQKPEKTLAETLIPFIDLTCLEETTTEQDITQLCQRANTPFGPVAAVCVYPRFVAHCKAVLPLNTIHIATVANFPKGTLSLKETGELIEAALNHGADEVDIVLPYSLFLAGEKKEVASYLIACERWIHPQAKLKVILETGVLKSPIYIAEASQLAIDAGADFLKTSTGKVPMGATLEAAEVMLNTISQSGAPVGFKVSGGIKTPDVAQQYYALTQRIFALSPKQPLTNARFRIGASQLLTHLLQTAI